MSQSPPRPPSGRRPPGLAGAFCGAVGWLTTAFGILAAGMVVAAVTITCQMIWVRFVLNASTIWQSEAVVYLMIGATLLGLGYVQKLRGHVNVDLLRHLLPPGGRRALGVGVLAVALAIAGLMTFYGVERWHLAADRGWRSDTVWGVKLWVPYLAMPVGFGLFALQLAADALAELIGVEEPSPTPPQD